MKRAELVAAVLTVRNISSMSDRERTAVCAWLRRLARDLRAVPESFSSTFRARYVQLVDNDGSDRV
jgi:hypothetical protein